MQGSCIVGQSYMSTESQHAKMIAYPIEEECIRLQTWLLWGTWLEKGKENSYNLLHFFWFRNKVVLALTLKP
jgi:hypothetical protein